MIQHKIEKNYNGILFFSPSAVESFFANNKLTNKLFYLPLETQLQNEIKKFQK